MHKAFTGFHHHSFGMLMPGRRYSDGSGYRYGFNGKENDNEVKGDGNQYDYGFRIYDPRVGRFLSVDPLIKDYPELTPYQFASNTPIQAIDIDGKEGMMPLKYWVEKKWDQFKAWWNTSSDYSTEVTKGYHAEMGVQEASENVRYTNGNAVMAGFGAVGYSLAHTGPLYTPRAKTSAAIPKGVTIRQPQEVEPAPIPSTPTRRATTAEPVVNTNKQAVAANGKNTGAAENNTASTSKTSPTLQQKKAASFTSEAIVRSRLMSQLKPDEILMDKPRFYIMKDGEETFTTPDFAIYNTKTNQFVSIPDAKNGGATLTTNQAILNNQGGEFRGSSRYPEAKPQKVSKGLVTKEKTSVPYN